MDQQPAPVMQKPPLALRILFILATLGYALGMLVVVFLIFLGSNYFQGVTFALAGIIAVPLTAVYLLILQVYKGKLWALTAYTVLVSLSFITTVNYFSRRTHHTPNDYRQLFSISFSAALLLYIWLHDRLYFK